MPDQQASTTTVEYKVTSEQNFQTPTRLNIIESSYSKNSTLNSLQLIDNKY